MRTPARATAGTATKAAARLAGGSDAPARRPPARRWATSTPVLSRVVDRPAGPPRTPFVLLVLGVLGAGLVGLLMLNSVTAGDSFAEARLRQQNAALALREQQLRREVAASEAPAALASAARRQGLVPAGDRGFLVVGANGSVTVAGTPVPATAAPPTTAPAIPSAAATPSTAPPGRSR